MAISPRQFIKTTEFHKDNLQAILAQHIDLPEAAGILVAMMYLQRSLNAAYDAAAAIDKEGKENDD